MAFDHNRHQVVRAGIQHAETYDFSRSHIDLHGCELRPGGASGIGAVVHFLKERVTIQEKEAQRVVAGRKPALKVRRFLRLRHRVVLRHVAAECLPDGVLFEVVTPGISFSCSGEQADILDDQRNVSRGLDFRHLVDISGNDHPTGHSADRLHGG